MTSAHAGQLSNILSRDFKDLERSRHTDVGRDQNLFELIQQLLVNLFASGEDGIEFIG